MQPDLVEIYRKFNSFALHLHVFFPPAPTPPSRAGIVFFFGGGWASGTPAQFYPQAAYLASIGVIGVCAEYRISSLHGTSPFESVDDAREAVRWLRVHANGLGLDPNRIAAAGGSAGGHLAACSALLPDSEQNTEATCHPDALILFNPVLDTTSRGYGLEKVGPARQFEISPCHLVRPGVCPTLLMHGTADAVAPYENAERFTRLMTSVGNSCELIPFADRPHGFFNKKREGIDRDKDYHETLAETERFLSRLAFLPGPQYGGGFREEQHR